MESSRAPKRNHGGTFLEKSSKKNVPVIVFGNSVSALGFARSLAGSGVDVYYATEKRNEATFSRRFKECFIIPKLEADASEYFDFLVRFLKQHPFSVVFPGSDTCCFNLASATTRLDEDERRGFHFLMPTKDILDTLLDKRRFYRDLSRRGISYPYTYFPESSDDVIRISREVDYPVYVKPSLSEVFVKIFQRKGFVARTKEELVNYCELASKQDVDVLVQKIIRGSDAEVFDINAYFDREHNPRGLFACHRNRGWPQGFGLGCLIESVPLSSVPEVKTVVDYLHDIGFYGLADAEFKRDPGGGEFKFLEVNPRLWLQNSFPAKCGINLNLMAYLDAVCTPQITLTHA
jgi:predicted ATP-grasp superfamily ATP-dependent carboligase